jgi:hypothetical protein
MGGTCSKHGEINAYMILVGKSQERIPVGSTKRSWLWIGYSGGFL